MKTKELNKSRDGKLNMLLLRQIYYFRQAHNGDEIPKNKLKLTNVEINEWFNE